MKQLDCQQHCKAQWYVFFDFGHSLSAGSTCAKKQICCSGQTEAKTKSSADSRGSPAMHCSTMYM
eukprot:163430-Amphidinium_carterae.4